MRILITGAAGFIGSSFMNWLVNVTEDEIIGVDNMSGGFMENVIISNLIDFFNIDVATNPKKLNQLFEWFNPNVCYHFAAYASEGRSNYIRSFIHQNNTVGTANVINACVNNNCKFVFTSSVAVYSGKPPFNEQTEPNPIDEYGLSKWASEKSIHIAGEEHGLDWCIIRPRNVYGINQNIFDPSRNLFGIWMYNALNNLPCEIFGRGSHVRSFTYIDDILKPLYNAFNHDGQIINLGSASPCSLNRAAEIFTEVTGYDNFIHTEARREVSEAFCETEKSRQLLEFEDNTSLYSGLTKMWAWAKTLKMRERMKPPPLEIKLTNHPSIV